MCVKFAKYVKHELAVPPVSSSCQFEIQTWYKPAANVKLMSPTCFTYVLHTFCLRSTCVRQKSKLILGK